MNIYQIFSLALSLIAYQIANAEDTAEVTATLESHIVIPASKFLIAPSDAPKNVNTSGKYIVSKSLNRQALIAGQNEQRLTSASVPIKGQPLQGFSGIKYLGKQQAWVITDNGFGTKANSSDALLFVNQFQFNFKQNSAKLLQTIFLKDPLHQVPFRIVNEDTNRRYLTGSDLDPESLQWVNQNLWIGDEFGPFLIKANHKGEILKVFETKLDGKLLQSPDNPFLVSPSSPVEPPNFNIKRSKGFEGLALSPDQTKLYALLEGPIYQATSKTFETANAQTVLRILEFDLNTEQWTNRSWFYPLEDPSHAIGDFNMIDAEHGLIIERDDNQGSAKYACKAKITQNCFQNPAKFKRIYKIRLSQFASTVQKLAYIDLLKIKDPNHISQKGHYLGNFEFPFLTIENVDVVDKNHIIVGMDNNYPFNANREPNRQDDNELILLEVNDFLIKKP